MIYLYIGYPIYIALIACFFIHFSINMCSPLILKLYQCILIEEMEMAKKEIIIKFKKEGFENESIN